MPDEADTNEAIRLRHNRDSRKLGSYLEEQGNVTFSGLAGLIITAMKRAHVHRGILLDRLEKCEKESE